MKETTPSVAGNKLIDDLADWLMGQALVETDLETLLSGCNDRLVAAGVPIVRFFLAFRTLHPLISGMGYKWLQGQGIEREDYAHDADQSDFQSSPAQAMIEQRLPYLRRRLTGPNALVDFPVMKTLKSQGYTDYLGFAVPFDEEGRDGVVGSWACMREGGFSEDDIAALMRVQRRLAVACKVLIRAQRTVNILEAYFGKNAARRILAGHIQRRDLDPIHAVIWYSDLRGSTSLAGQLAPSDFLDLLDAYFECSAGAVLAHGGEVLLLIGDAVLAIFPIGEERSEREACAAAMAAAREAMERLHAVNAERSVRGQPALAFGLGLHVGDVSYGNIGVPERLELTVVGEAANEVARIESLSKDVGHAVVASGRFARNLDIDWTPLGVREMAGVEKKIEVFGCAVC